MDIIPVTTVETYQSALFLLNICFTFTAGLFPESSTVYQVNAYISRKNSYGTYAWTNMLIIVVQQAAMSATCSCTFAIFLTDTKQKQCWNERTTPITLPQHLFVSADGETKVALPFGFLNFTRITSVYVAAGRNGYRHIPLLIR